jgi:phosphodiesterase/alkaline phosphatase D-like protein
MKNNKVVVSVKLATASSDVRLVVSTEVDLSSATESETVSTNADGLVKIGMENLLGNTQYYFGVRVDGVMEPDTGRFKTWGGATASFRFGFSSCCASSSNSAVFSEIVSKNPLFFLHLGDMHYEDIADNNESVFQAAYDDVLAQSTQKDFFSKIPLAYVWDDHDYGPNDSGYTSPSRSASLAAYKSRIPHHPLGGSEGIYQSFVVGKVRFILTDLRYFRGSDGTVMGATQQAWFENELQIAAGASQFACITMSFPWVSASGPEDWSNWSANRVVVADIIKDAGMGQRSFIVSGDMHASALYAPDFQTSGDYATGGGANMPVLHASPLDRSGSSKGGPYHIGPQQGGNRFGTVDIVDNDDGVLGVTFTAWSLSSGVLSSTIDYSITLPHGS